MRGVLGIKTFFLGGGQRPLGAGRRYPLFTLRKPWPQNGIIPFPVSIQSGLSGTVGVEKGGLLAALQSEGLR
jgi:hypothetical protein